MNNGTVASSPRESLHLQAGLLEANLTIFWLLFAAALVFFQQVSSLDQLLPLRVLGRFECGMAQCLVIWSV